MLACINETICNRISGYACCIFYFIFLFIMTFNYVLCCVVKHSNTGAYCCLNESKVNMYCKTNVYSFSKGVIQIDYDEN